MGIELRPIEESDFAPLALILQEKAVAEWWGPNDEASLREEVGDKDVTAFAIVLDDQPVGMVEISEEEEPGYRHAELDIFLASAHQGRGIGADALRQALRHVFGERGHHRAIIIPAAANAGAIRCYEKVGFKPVGIFRRADRGRDSLAMDMLAEELE
jgi:aminoglycoside 6'-N-acetyltransferase